MSNKNNNTRIFITGADGQLAKSFSEIHRGEGLYFANKIDLDVTNRKEVFKKIKKFKPDIVLHFASMTRGDECAENPDKAFLINVEGTRNIVEICKKNNVTLLFVSTNEIFDGKKKFPYKETDKPNPITVIGQTKLEAEKIIKKNLKKYFIVRTSWLYSKWSLNFIHAVLDKARKEVNLELVRDEISSPTYSLDLVLAIKKLISTKKYGIYHISNLGSVSRLDFAKKAFEIYKMKKVKITPKSLNEYKRKSKPPHYSPLNNTKAKKHGILMPRWDKALERFLLSTKI